MKLVSYVGPILLKLGGEAALRLICEAGFDGVDWSFNREFGENSPWMQENWKEYAQKLLDIAAEYGVPFRQGHAFAPSSTGEPERDAEIKSYMIRTIEACGMMGIQDLVIHPIQHLPYNTNRQELFDLSVAFYKELLPYAEAHKVVLCTENMYQSDKRRKVLVESVCARPEEFCAMIDTINSPWLKGCFDIGHAPLVSQDPAYMIRALGKERLVALHVHDVDLMGDTHTLPYVGRVNWKEVTDALAEIGYAGDFTYEIGGWFNSFPTELLPDALRLAERTGRYLIRQIENV